MSEVRIVSGREWRERAEAAEAALRKIKADEASCRCAGHVFPCPLWKGYSQVAWKS